MSLRIAALPKAMYFNEIGHADTFYIIWKTKAKRILTIVAENSRYEVDAVVKNERAEMEINALE